MNKKADLQVHSTYSDGAYSPKELFKIAKRDTILLLVPDP